MSSKSKVACGIALVATPFLGLLAMLIEEFGWQGLFVLVGAFGIAGMIVLGVHLIIWNT